jgi:hypothetical protein
VIEFFHWAVFVHVTPFVPGNVYVVGSHHPHVPAFVHPLNGYVVVFKTVDVLLNAVGVHPAQLNVTVQLVVVVLVLLGTGNTIVELQFFVTPVCADISTPLNVTFHPFGFTFNVFVHELIVQCAYNIEHDVGVI